MNKTSRYTLIALPFIFLAGLIYTTPPLDSHGYWLGSTRSQIRMLETAVEAFRADNGRIPSEQEQLEILAKDQDGSNRGQYINAIPPDRWGNKYVYKFTTTNDSKYLIYSAGPNGIDESGLGDDVVNWEKDYDCELYNDCPTFKDNIFIFFILATAISWSILAGYLVYTGVKLIKNKNIR